MDLFLDASLSLDIVENRLQLGRQLHPAEAAKLRGYFGAVFGDQVLLHHHLPNGRLVYDYPRVQFKILERTAYLVGLAEGCDVVMQVWTEANRACIDGDELPIQEASLVK